MSTDNTGYTTCARCHQLTRPTDLHDRASGACWVCGYGAGAPSRSASAGERVNRKLRAKGIEPLPLPFPPSSDPVNPSPDKETP